MHSLPCRQVPPSRPAATGAAAGPWPRSWSLLLQQRALPPLARVPARSAGRPSGESYCARSSAARAAAHSSIAW
jgi:hypothetical protein